VGLNGRKQWISRKDGSLAGVANGLADLGLCRALVAVFLRAVLGFLRARARHNHMVDVCVEG
jgi:hypothetical protein